jgi:hypothetical protein
VTESDRGSTCGSRPCIRKLPAETSTQAVIIGRASKNPQANEGGDGTRGVRPTSSLSSAVCRRRHVLFVCPLCCHCPQQDETASLPGPRRATAWLTAQNWREKREKDSPERCMPSALRLTGPIKGPGKNTGWRSWSATPMATQRLASPKHPTPCAR